MKTVIIDVRTEKEYLEGSYPGAVNRPHGSFDVQRFENFRDNHIALLCFSGNRAQKVKTLLELEGFEHVSLLQNQMVHIAEASNANSSIWTVDRQFRMALGILLGIALSSHYLFQSSVSLFLLLGLFAGLLYSVITDNCYLKSLIAVLPWNKANSMNASITNQQILTT